MIIRIFTFVFLALLFFGFASAHLMSDQGTNVRILNGSLLDFGNLTVLVYTDSIAGSLIFNSTTQGAIVNGSWNLMINPTLEYGISYWKDYAINGEDLDFDGNERLEFQSPLGYINNFSFINLSLINSCPAGSSIRLIYSNGSVVCETSSGNISVDLTNYALKNQSETFAGNITTPDRGFFGFLGSLANRISKLFVSDIDASGNVNASGNVTAYYFKGDGSLLANLPAGSESDPLWTANSTSVLYVSSLPLENRTRVHCSNVTGAVSNLCTVTNGGIVNLFDQVLNTTSNVTFANITVSSNSAFAGNVSASAGFFGFLGSALSRISKIFAVDLDVSNNITSLGNISSRFYIGSLNLSNFPNTACSGTDKVIGVNSSGGVVCGTDQIGSSSGSTVPVKFINVLGGAVTDTNAPATERIIGNSQYLVCTNATGYGSFRYGFARSATNGGANAIVYMKYISNPATTIVGSSYTNLSNLTLQSLIYAAPNIANLSAYYTMNSNLGDVCIGAFQVGGNGVLDPQWRNIWVELR